MSPEIVKSPITSDPVSIVRAACAKAVLDHGVHISSTAEFGVHCTSTAKPAWEILDGGQVINPLAAVLLVHQPPMSVVEEALAHVLGVNILWVVGFDDGAAGKDDKESNILREPGVRLYKQGHRAGVRFACKDKLGPILSSIPSPEERRGLVEALAAIPTSYVLDILTELEQRRAEQGGRELHVDAAVALDALADSLRTDGI